MKKYSKYFLVGASLLLAFSSQVVFAGNLDSPGTPTAGSNMPTLTSIYDRLDTGAVTPGTASFQGPAAGPTAGTGRSLSEVEAKLPAPDNTDGATVDDVAAGKTFWGMRTDGTWGPQTGASTGCPTCNGTMNGTRWCDNGNGTVTDMLGGDGGAGKCLIWMKDANCNNLTLAGIAKSGFGVLTWNDAQIWTTILHSSLCGLSDGSSIGDWRQPTKNELAALISGTEPVSPTNPRAFTNVQNISVIYWSSTTAYDFPLKAYGIWWGTGTPSIATGNKIGAGFAWPVRSGM